MSELQATSAASLASAPRRPRRGRSRAARVLATLLICAGGLVLIDGVVTLLWQEPITALIAKLHQDRLRSDLRSIEVARPSAAEERALASIAGEQRRIAYLAAQLQSSAANGSPVGRIVIPRIGADFVLVDGTDTADLEAGPGVYSDRSFPGTGFPGRGETTAIAGHRTTYLAPFHNINELAPGDRILLHMPYADFTYTVLGQRTVLPTDVRAAIADFGYNRLVLSACTPLFSAAKRLLVYARLTRTVPVGPARLLTEGELPTTIEQPLNPPPPRRLPPVLESLDPNGVAPLS